MKSSHSHSRPQSGLSHSKTASFQPKSKVLPPEDPPQVLYDGITLNQWKSIRSFVIAGESKQRKRNEHIARTHFLNLRSMYRRINQINKRKHVNLERAIYKGKEGFQPHSGMNQGFGIPMENEEIQEMEEGEAEEEIEPEIEEIKEMNKKKQTRSDVERVSKRSEKERPVKERSSRKKGISDFENTGEKGLIEKHLNSEEEIEEQEFSREKHKKQIEEDEEEEIEGADRFKGNRKKSEEEEATQQIDEEELMKKIPVLKSKSEEDKNAFKEAMIEIILVCGLFTEETLSKLYEMTLEKNKKTKESVIEKLFVEIKELIYEEFENMQNQMEDQNEMQN